MRSEFGVAFLCVEWALCLVSKRFTGCLSDPPANLNLTLAVPCAPSMAADLRWKCSARLQNSISSNPESPYLLSLLEAPWAIILQPSLALTHLSRAEWCVDPNQRFVFFPKLDGIFMASEPCSLCTHDATISWSKIMISPFSSTTAPLQRAWHGWDTDNLLMGNLFIKAFKGGPFPICTQSIKKKTAKNKTQTNKK